MKQEQNTISEGRTPGKWQLHKHAFAHVETEEGRSIANCGSFSTNADGGKHIEENKANAAYIVEACNNYEALKQQNERLLNALKNAIERMDRARGILNRNDGVSNWRMLDTSDLKAAIQSIK